MWGGLRLTHVSDRPAGPRRVAWTGSDWFCYGLCLACAACAGVLLGLTEDIRHPPSFFSATLILPVTTLAAAAIFLPVLSRRVQMFHLLFLTLVGLGLSGLGYYRAGPPALVAVQVRSELKNLATALEMYAVDNHGDYPVDLEALVTGNYLGPHTYPAQPPLYEHNQQPSAFTLTCRGRFRDRRGDGPWLVVDQATLRYSSTKGLIEPPEFAKAQP